MKAHSTPFFVLGIAAGNAADAAALAGVLQRDHGAAVYRLDDAAEQVVQTIWGPASVPPLGRALDELLWPGAAVYVCDADCGWLSTDYPGWDAPSGSFSLEDHEFPDVSDMLCAGLSWTPCPRCGHRGPSRQPDLTGTPYEESGAEFTVFTDGIHLAPFTAGRAVQAVTAWLEEIDPDAQERALARRVEATRRSAGIPGGVQGVIVLDVQDNAGALAVETLGGRIIRLALEGTDGEGFARATGGHAAYASIDATSIKEARLLVERLKASGALYEPPARAGDLLGPATEEENAVAGWEEADED